MKKRLALVDKPHLRRFKTRLDEFLDSTFVKKTDKATVDSLGIVKPDGTTITIDNGVISGSSSYELPVASLTTLGGVKIDGQTITIDDGVISASARNVNYSTAEQATGNKWVDNSSVYQSTFVFPNGISCSADTWTELCNKPTNIDILINGFVSNGEYLSRGDIKVDSGKIYINPSLSCTVKYLTIEYTKNASIEYLSDLTWSEANEFTWSELSETKWG